MSEAQASDQKSAESRLSNRLVRNAFPRKRLQCEERRNVVEDVSESEKKEPRDQTKF